MGLLKAYRTKPIIAILAGLMLMVALACAGDSATPTSPPTATSPAPTATSPASGPTATAPAGATATAVPDAMTDLTWMEQYLQSPGYNPEWGAPIKGGTYIFGAQRDGTTFNLESQSCCYTHGCYAGLPSNSLFRIDAWTGDLTTIEPIQEGRRRARRPGTGFTASFQPQEIRS